MGEAWSKINITGTTIHYYLYCKRKCWLHINKINMEDNSEYVAIGKAIHENLQKRSANTEIAIDNIKIDKITDTYVIEIKKSSADVESAKWQLLYYLYVLESKGVHRKGKLSFYETKTKENKTEVIELTDEIRTTIDKIKDDINLLYESKMPEKANLNSKCKKCSYFEYCFI